MDERSMLDDAIRDLRVRMDALEREMQAMRRGAPATDAPSNADMRAFARQLIEQVGAELEAMRPKDDGKTLGAMQDGVMHDGRGVYLARYALPDGSVLIWQRDDTGPEGFTLRVSTRDGGALPYERAKP